MAYIFGDSFDLYAAIADMAAGYWDGSTNSTGMSLVAGRFSGSQALQFTSGASGAWYKNSGSNDAVHHIVCSERQTAALTGTSSSLYISFGDGATAQCSVVFRSDGAMLLTSGGPTGTTLDTYTGAVGAQNTWTAFEIEVVINNTTGSWAVRKNGNTSNDHALGSLNTRTTANNYASRITVGMQTGLSAQQLDDLLWRSDASSVPWVGDIRCYTRMPASDAGVQFSRNPMSVALAQATTVAIAAGTARYTVAQTAPCDGSIATASVSLSVGYTGNMKCAIFANSGNNPTTVLATATPISNPATGSNTFTFPTPATLTKGTTFIIGFDSDTSSGTWNAVASSQGSSSTTAYASFPVASPTVTAAQAAPACTINFTPTTSNSLVNEAQQDGATSYVYDSNVGDADFYGIAALAGTPASTIAVTTRGFFEKSDAGTRNAAVQLKSGATTVQSTSTALSTSFGWLWRTDTVDPATGAAWTATGVNNVQIGPITTA